VTAIDAAASNLVASSTIAALMRCLVLKGALSARDVREIYETALLLLEQQQGTVPEHADAFVAARAVIEEGLAR